MLYGLETVPLTKRQEEEMEVAELRMLRLVMGVKRANRVKKKYIRGSSTKVKRLGLKLREGRLRWYGHVMSHMFDEVTEDRVVRDEEE